MAESDTDFKLLFEQKIVQPVKRKLKETDDRRLQLEKRVARLELCLWGIGAWCLLKTVLAVVAILKLCR